jgi:hypothetical protein
MRHLFCDIRAKDVLFIWFGIVSLRLRLCRLNAFYQEIGLPVGFRDRVAFRLSHELLSHAFPSQSASSPQPSTLAFVELIL